MTSEVFLSPSFPPDKSSLEVDQTDAKSNCKSEAKHTCHFPSVEFPNGDIQTRTKTHSLFIQYSSTVRSMSFRKGDEVYWNEKSLTEVDSIDTASTMLPVVTRLHSVLDSLLDQNVYVDRHKSESSGSSSGICRRAGRNRNRGK